MKVAIIGAGAAGYFAAIQSKQHFPECDVTLLEKESKPLKKVKISGGGRCNVTHACFKPKTLTSYYPRGQKQLLKPFEQFSPKQTMDWFEQQGVSLKVEPDGRVFPQSNSSQSVIDALMNSAKNLGVHLDLQKTVRSVHQDEGLANFVVCFADGQELIADKLILATGSAELGYQVAESLGHSLIQRVPSLFTLKIDDSQLTELKGLSVPSVQVQLAGRKALKQSGPLLITHWGLSGPAILKLSSWEAPYLYECAYRTQLIVYWMDGMKQGAIEKALHDYLREHPKQTFSKHSPFKQLPLRLWSYLCDKSSVPLNAPCQEISSKALNRLVQTLQADSFNVHGKGVFKEEFVTCGGVDLAEVDLKTMQSRVCPGVFFAGEILNIDGLTGGFNFQNAWTTAYLAAQGIQASCP